LVLLFTLALQMGYPKYVPLIYWLNAMMVSVVGSLITDLIVDNLGTPEWACILAFFILMRATFGLWYYQERTLSIHSINTFALGTAVGAGLAEKAKLGYWQAMLVFAGMIAVIALLYYFKLLGEITAFWLVYILTRPLGASLGDFLLQCPVTVGATDDGAAAATDDGAPDYNPGGLYLGPGITSAIFFVSHRHFNHLPLVVQG
jgi:uncharacterized membrane-anchored protein